MAETHPGYASKAAWKVASTELPAQAEFDFGFNGGSARV